MRARRVRYLGNLLRPYRRRVVAALVAILVATAATLTPPFLAGRAVDDVIATHNTSALDAIVAAILAAVLIGWFAGWAQSYLVGWVGQHVLRDLRVKLFSHLQDLSVAFFERHKTGILISRLTNNVEALDQLVSTALNALISDAVIVVGTIVMLFVLDLKLALVVSVAIPLILLSAWLFQRAAASAYRTALNTIAELTAYMGETFTGARVVRAFAREQHHRREFTELNERNREASMRQVALAGFYLPWIEFVSIAVIAAIVLYGGYQVVEGHQQLGVLVAFIAYLRMALSPLTDLAGLYTTYLQGAAALDQSFELLDQRPAVVERPDAVELPPLGGEVRLEGVSSSYDGVTPCLREVDLHIEAGQTIAIVGPTGGGKSTLVKLIMRFYDPQSGRVLVDGRDIREATIASLRGQMGIVPQELMLFSGTIRRNIAFSRPDARDDEVELAARSVGVLEPLLALPDGLDTEVGEHGSNLARGELQLVALARAAMTDPRLVILDEATSTFGPRLEQDVISALERLTTGRTAIIVAHRLSTVRRADRVIVIDAGQIVEQGTHEELLSLNGEYARLHGVWTRST